MEGQTKTENGAVAWSTDILGKDMTESKDINDLTSILTSMWSATSMTPESITTQVDDYMQICNSISLTDPITAMNFRTLLMNFGLYKRSVRNGGGRKDESRAVLSGICKANADSSVISRLLKAYFTQGYWKDAWLIYQDSSFTSDIKDLVLSILAKQLKDDRETCMNLDKAKNKETKDNLIKILSNAAKFCPQVKGKKNKKEGSKAKDTVLLIIPLAKLLFPEIKEDTWYYMNVKGKTDTSKKIPVTEKTAVFYKYRSLLNMYTRFMKEIRKNIPFVEKYMKDGSFQNINPSMLTSVNKMKLDNTFKNKLPRYLSSKNTKVPKKKIEEAKLKYGADKRFDTEDRNLLQVKYEKYEEEVTQKQKEKAEKMQELKNKMDNANAEEKKKLEEELEKIKAEKVTNFSAGNPIDILKAYDNSWVSNPTYESCIKEMALGKFADLLDLGILSVSDTSGSMGSSIGNDIRAIDVCIAMTAFFSMNAPGSWNGKFIQFAGKPYVRDANQDLNGKPSFIEFCKYIFKNQINESSTNFEGVLRLLKDLFTGSVSSDLPKYIIFWSDMQFNQTIHLNQGLTAAGQVKELFLSLGFSELDTPYIIFWNLNCHDNRPALASDQGVIMLSGFNPQMLIDLDTIVQNTMPESEFIANEKAIYEEQMKKKKIDTWTTIVQTLTSSLATVDFQASIKELVGHTF